MYKSHAAKAAGQMIFKNNIFEKSQGF